MRRNLIRNLNLCTSTVLEIDLPNDLHLPFAVIAAISRSAVSTSKTLKLVMSIRYLCNGIESNVVYPFSLKHVDLNVSKNGCFESSIKFARICPFIYTSIHTQCTDCW